MRRSDPVDAPGGVADHAGVPGDPLTSSHERTQSNLFWRHLGVEVDSAGDGWVRLRVAVRDELRNGPGAPMHGGVLSSLVDMAVGGALATTQERAEGGVNQVTLDLNVSFVAAATAGVVVAEGRLLRRGRSVAFGEARITDEAGRLLAVGRATYMIPGPRPGSS
jgi:acyl-CoA thioesterase